MHDRSCEPSPRTSRFSRDEASPRTAGLWPRALCAYGWALLCGLALWIHASFAHAQKPEPAPLPRGSKIGVLPLRGDVKGHDVAPVLEAYRGIGYAVVPPAQIAKTLEQDAGGKVCLEAVARCDFRGMLRVLELDALVLVALWVKDGKPYEVAVRVFRSETEGAATQEVGERPVSAVLKAVATSALVQTESALIDVRVESEPERALVSVDRRQEGTTPATFPLPSGKHLLIVSHPGFVTRSQFVDVPDFSDEAVVYRLVLERDTASVGDTVAPDQPPARGGDEPPSALERRTSPWNYVIGGALAAAAAPLLAYGIHNAATAGDCLERDALGQCRERVVFGARPGVSLGSGILGVLGAAYFFGLRPLTVSVSGSDASVRLEGKF